MMRADDAPHGKIGNGRIHVRNEVQPPRPDP
jgi:hypothetical protein